MPVHVSIGSSAPPVAPARLVTPLSELPPWDQATYYGLPTEKQVAMNNSAVQLVKGDPLRAKLQFSVLSNGAASMSGGLVMISLNSNVTVAMGIALFDGSFPWLLSFDLHGPIVQQAWFAISNTGAIAPFPIITVQETRYIRWPGRLGDPSVLQQVDDECNNSEGCADRDAVVRRINGDSGLQRAEDTDSDIAAAIESCQRGHQRSCDRNVRVAVGGRRISLSLG